MDNEKETIEISKKTKDKLDAMKRPGESYEDLILFYLPEGIVHTFDNVYEEKPAFVLDVPCARSEHVEKKSVSWNDLKNSKVGDYWENYGYSLVKATYNMDATVMYKDEDSCLIKIKRFNNIYKHLPDEQWFAVYYFF